MAHPIYRFSSIARPLEAKYRTNLAVLILLPVIAAGLTGFEVIYRGTPLPEALTGGLIGALAAFLAWALTRELDPDRNPGAFVAMALCVAASAFGFGPGLFAAAVILMSVRVVVRTVGPPARTSDFALVLVLAGSAAWLTGGWWLCLVAAAAFVIDYVFDRSQKLAPVFAAGALAVAALTFVTSGWSWAETDTLVRGWIVAVVTVGGLFALMTVTCPPVASHCDANNDPLDQRRIQAGMALALGAAALTLLGGIESLTASLPIWAAMGGVIEGRAMPKRKI